MLGAGLGAGGLSPLPEAEAATRAALPDFADPAVNLRQMVRLHQLGGNTVTFFRDVETLEFLYEFRNPWTGKTDAVKPAVQGGNLGFSYGVEGIWPVRLDGTPIGEPKPAPLRLQWHAMGDHVWLQHQTVYPPGMPAMHGQRQTLFARVSDLSDDKLEALPATFSSTVFMGWLKWMDMKGDPGHVIWHASGAKLRSIDDLPREY
ncbi:MAG: DUF1838 domain-containing protein, partial [Gammaproteobacteria bacterium]|nr:DUF1838 domain-containing protein [Gammaproteobacteria bacterium]